MINPPTETVVDIVLDNPENLHGNVCIENLSNVVACQHVVCWLFRIKIFPRFLEHRRSFLEVFYKNSFSTLINAVTKYLNFCSSGSKLESITCKFTESRAPSEVFFEEFHYKCKTAIMKMYQDDCFWGQLYFRNIPLWLLLKDSCKDIFILEILGYTYFTFLTLASYERGTNFYEYFF